MRSGYSLRGRAPFIPVKHDAKKSFTSWTYALWAPKNVTFRPNGFDYHGETSLFVGVVMLTIM